MKRTDEEMARPAAGEPNRLAKDRLDAAHRTAWHIGWHTGQVSSLRRALGMPGVL